MTKEEIIKEARETGSRIATCLASATKEATGVEIDVIINDSPDYMKIALKENHFHSIDCYLKDRYESEERKIYKKDHVAYNIFASGSIQPGDITAPLFIVFGEIMRNPELSDLILNNMRNNANNYENACNAIKNL